MLYEYDLRSVDAKARKATFRDLASDQDDEIEYAMMHVTPPMSAPDFIKHSPLANAAGWVAADKHTLQYPKYPNVFALGDVSELPTSKTCAAIRKQAPTVVANLLAAIDGSVAAQRFGQLVAADSGGQWEP